MGETNICRPITFYNHFVPAIEKRGNWEYCAFGTFDGVEKQEKIVSKKASDILKGIWEHQKAFSESLKGTYTAQTIYAFCYDEEEKEEEFWQDDEEMPFTFFCRIQFKACIDLYRKRKKELESFFQKTDGISVMIYATYDNSDAFIVMKASLYSTGVKLINRLHQGFNFAFDQTYRCELKNSFTVFAVKQNMINRMDIEACRRRFNAKDNIAFASIRLIEKNCGEIQKVSAHIEGKLKNLNVKHGKMQPILGSDDQMLLLQNIGWGDFLGIFRTQEQTFYDDYIAGITTTIAVEGSENEKEGYDEFWKGRDQNAGVDVEEQNKETPISASEIYKKEVDLMREKIKDTSKYKELHMILNLMPKFADSVFSDYIHFSVLKPLDMLIDLMKDQNKDSYYEFIKKFSVYVQNSTKSDRHSMQSMDFNTKIYDIPAKLNAFYTAFIYSVSDILNISEQEEKAHRYEFFVIPGVTDIVHVTELYQRVSEDKRLICVEIPESKFYEVHEIMIIFAHEVAHYVGTIIRKRKERYKDFLQSMACMYINYVESYWLERQGEIGIDISDEEWKALKRRMGKMLWAMLEREEHEEYIGKYQIGKDRHSKKQIENIIEKNKIYSRHSSFLIQNIYRAFMDFTQLALPNVFAGLVFGCSEEKQREVYEFIEDISEQFMVRYTEETTRMTLDTVLKQLIDLYEESFADLMSISILGLTGKDYLDTIINNSRDQSVDLETLCTSSVLYRILVVYDVMTCGKKETEWTRSILKEDENREKRFAILINIEKLRLTILKGWKKVFSPEEGAVCIQEEGTTGYYSYRTNCFYAMIEKDVYVAALSYLKKCKEYFNSVCMDKREEMSRLFSEKVENSNIELQLSEMEKFIHSYEEKMKKELNDKIN